MELVDMNSLGLFDLKILSVQVGFTLHTHSKLNTFFSRLVPAPVPAPVPVLVPKSAFLVHHFTLLGIWLLLASIHLIVVFCYNLILFIYPFFYIFILIMNILIFIYY